MRQLSSNAYNGVISRITSEVFLALLEVEIETLDVDGNPQATVYRVVSGTDQDVISNGETYTPYPFDMVLPEDSLESVEQVQLTIDNVDRVFVDGIRAAIKPILFSLKIVLESTPDTVEVGLENLDGREITWTATTITAKLTLTDTWNQKFPGVGETYDPRQCPGLF